MEMKKISFGFSKKSVKVNFQPVVTEKKDKIELIECVEGQSIKIVGKENENKEPPPLIIPLRNEDKTTIPGRLAKILEINEKKVKVNKEEKPVPKESSEEETLEQKAAREILEDLKEKKEQEEETLSFVVPLKPEDLPLEGAIESSVDDYENVPISQFGLAMLRGMGWKDEANKKVDNKKEAFDAPVQRPKGMGLGADKMAKQKTALIPPAKDEVLEMKKGAFVKVVAGKKKNSYGQIEGLDEDTGRVIIKFALGGNRESLNEFMVQLVSKQEYSKYSKIINSAKYEEFKNRELNAKDEKVVIVKNERKSSSPEILYESKPKVKQEKRYDSPDKRSLEGRSKIKQEEHKERRSYSNSPKREDRNHREHRRSRSREERSRRHNSSDDESISRPHKSSSSYSKKKSSHKYKSRNRHPSSDEDSSKHHKNHKKKTKKSKKQRSRSRSRR